MKKKDKLTKSIFGMYQQYPFPNINYKMDYSLPLIRFLKKKAKKGQNTLLDNSQILEAGCGTGNTLIKLAESCPLGNFTGVDMTLNSLKLANKEKKLRKINNLKFEEQNIINMNLKKKFDVIMCIGVLHHLSDMQKGLINLKKHLKKSGYLIMWLYGKDGRFKLNLNQRMLSLLLKNKKSLKEKIQITKKILSGESNKFLDCHFNVPYSSIEDNWEEGRKFLLKNDNWIVDQFLHYNENVVDMRDIFHFTEKANFKIDEWLGVSLEMKKFINDKEIIKIFNKLSLNEKYLVIDDLIKPKYYFLVLKNKS